VPYTYNNISHQVTIDIDPSGSMECDGRNPYLSGEDLVGKGVVLREGVAVFSSTQAFCAPNGTLGVEFTALLGGLEVSEGLAQDYYIKLKTKLHFRLCSFGEYILEGDCVVCPSGTYSLTEEVTKELVCVPCADTEGIAACESDQIVLSDGYWRRHDGNTAVLTCPLAAASCVGGNGTGDLLCRAGYEGPLCAVCSENFFPSQSECLACDSSSVITPTLLIYFCVIFTVVSLAILSAYYKYFYVDADKEKERRISVAKRLSGRSMAESMEWQQRQSSESSVSDVEDGYDDDEPVSRLQLWILWFKMRYGQIVVKAKIIVVTFQVVTSVPSVMSVSMPNSFTNFIDGFNFINLSFADAFPLSCSGVFTFIDKLVLTTLAPIMLSILLCMFFFIEYGNQRRQIQRNKQRQKGEKAAAFNRIKEKYLNYFFYLSYLVLPSVTTTIFQTFLCTDVDPDREDSDESDSYLTADMNISCHSDYYKNGVAYAVCMICVYPIGVSAMYLVLLYYNRAEIRTREESSDDDNAVPSVAAATGGGAANPLHTTTPALAPAAPAAAAAPAAPAAADDELSPSAARLAFLWEAYEPKFWYWEIIETSRRLMLTAVLSLVSPGSSEQAVASIMVSILYIKLYREYEPYVNDNDDELAELGQYQIFFTFFGALILQNSLLSSSWDTAVGVLLIFVNLGVVMMALLAEIRNVDDPGGDLSEAEKVYHRSQMSYNKQLSQTNATDLDACNTATSNAAAGSDGCAPPRRPQRRRSSVAEREAERRYDSAKQKQTQTRPTPVPKRQAPTHVAQPVDGRAPPRGRCGSAGEVGSIELSNFPPRVVPAKAHARSMDHADSDDDDVIVSNSKTVPFTKADGSKARSVRTVKAGGAKTVASPCIPRSSLTTRDSQAADSDDDSDYEGGAGRREEVKPR
jgi:hypothetical protein